MQIYDKIRPKLSLEDIQILTLANHQKGDSISTQNTQESPDSLQHPALIRYEKWIRKSSY